VRRADLAAPLVCAALNFVAALAMAVVLAPGTPLVADPAQRAAYVSAHQLEWRLGWLIWMAAGLSLLWFYAWWRARVGAPHVVLVVAAFGYVADLVAETAFVLYLVTEPFTVALTGGVANGLYTVAGALLTLATPLPALARAWAWTMWTIGALLSIGAFLGIPLQVATATALLFALFCPWCVYLARRLA
jgi:hypothetical protein